MFRKVACCRRSLLAAMVLAGTVVGGPVLGHTPASTNTNWDGLVYLISESQLSVPANNASYGGDITYSSGSPHYVRWENQASGGQSVTVSYIMDLYHDGQSYATRQRSNYTLFLGAGSGITVDANLSFLCNFAGAGGHTGEATGTISTSNGPTAGTTHPHNWTKT